MAITLITGAPGNGKTLLLLWEVERRRQAEHRPVYYSGVKDLLLPWELFGDDSEDPRSPHMTDPATWNNLPVGSIIVIDECQRLFRTRSTGSKVPEYVSALETHRHKGYDIYLVTQAPALIDSNVRNLVETHKHLMRKFGSKWATVHEWKGVKLACITSRKDSIESQFRYPKEVYSWYKSAEVHTVKMQIPKKVLLLLSLPLLLAGLVYMAVSTLANFGKDKPPPVVDASSPLAPQFSGAQGRGVEPAFDYLGSFVPRVPGLPHTAPRYDEATAAVIAPYPAACVIFGPECRCYTTQATRLAVQDVTCRSIAEKGFFVDWEQHVPGAAAGAVVPSDASTRPASPMVKAYPAAPSSVPPVGLSGDVTARPLAHSGDADVLAFMRAR
ncbi:zonular occludens toxin domain-containing protein [Hydrogenophaga sp.]|uniref:zonular occludens toxin domain-containing protein n=1 Tax=Hydrogenophaga sp. TaxID=1904254 RepID=UPI0027335DB0|nr:zonular occludens toxin domain-containing protein [Hydrogenophaga sp.]MDP3887127.1 zonular occludens toxin domain-containing protein [Hydrogenophaga sp.]